MLRVLALAVLLGAGIGCQRRGPDDANLAVTHADVIDVRDGTLLRDQTIFVKDGRIVAVQPSSQGNVPDGATIVDATGQFVIPGLWDAHVHSATSASWHFPLLLAHGVTSVRNMHTTVDTALALTTALKRELASGALLGPRLLANGPLIDSDPPAWPGAVVARNATEGRAAVDSLAAGGADFIKVYDSLDRETFLAIADQARLRRIPLDGHMPMLVPPDQGAAAGMRTVEHLGGIAMGCSTRADSLRTEFSSLRSQSPGLPFPENMLAVFALGRRASDTRDPAECAATVNAYKAAGVAVVPTFTMFANGDHPELVLRDSARMALVSPALAKEWNAMAGDPLTARITALMEPLAATSRANFQLLHHGGVPILAGTDLGNPFLVPGVSLHDELELLVDAGLTPLEALQAATLLPARVFGLSDSLGIVAPGQLADLVLLRENPLEDIRNSRSIAGVVVAGRYLGQPALDEMRNAGRDPNRQVTVGSTP